MNHLFICRHGDAQSRNNGGLTGVGFEEARTLAQAIYKIIGPSCPPVRILVSPTLRTATTGRLIADQWGELASGQHLEESVEFSEDALRANDRIAVQLLQRLNDAEIGSVVVVTHQRIANWPLFFFLRDILGVESSLFKPELELKTGQAWHLDLKTKEVRLLP